MSVENTCWWKLMPSGVPRGVSFDQVMFCQASLIKNRFYSNNIGNLHLQSNLPSAKRKERIAMLQLNHVAKV